MSNVENSAAVPPRPTGYNTTYNHHGGYHGPHNGHYHGGYNGNYPGGPNGNYPGGYNGIYHEGYNPNYHGGYNGYAPRRPGPVETKFVKYAEGWYKDNFSGVESLTTAVRSISTMLENTYTAMTSTFRAVLSVTENCEKLSNNFGHIFQAVKIYKWFSWLYAKFMKLILGCEVPLQTKDDAPSEDDTANADKKPPTRGIPYGILSFLGVLISGPYLVSKFFMSKFQESMNPGKWTSPGRVVTVTKNFNAASPNEMSLQVNKQVILAPNYIQTEMKLDNTGWAFVIGQDCSGIAPISHFALERPEPVSAKVMEETTEEKTTTK